MEELHEGEKQIRARAGLCREVFLPFPLGRFDLYGLCVPKRVVFGRVERTRVPIWMYTCGLGTREAMNVREMLAVFGGGLHRSGGMMTRLRR